MNPEPLASPRFYAPDVGGIDQPVVLSEDEAHHLTRVLRLGVGALVHVFDGRGQEWRARVTRAGRTQVTVELLDQVPTRRPAVAITVAQGVLKGEAMDDVVRDCTMLGVAALHPLLTQHTAVKPSVAASAGERWRRVALASAKQCGAAALPQFTPVQPFASWIARGLPSLTLMLVEPVAGVPAMTLRELAAAPQPPEATLMVGPEGGWSRKEVEVAKQAGARPVSLGPMTLRADSAALVAAGALLALWQPTTNPEPGTLNPEP